MGCTRIFGKKSKGHNLEAKTGETIIFACDTSSLPNTHFYKLAIVSQLWGVQECKLHKISIKTQYQPYLYATNRLGLIYIPIKFHEDIPNGYRVIGRTIIFREKILSKRHNSETKMERTIILACDASWPNTHPYKIA